MKQKNRENGFLVVMHLHRGGNTDQKKIAIQTEKREQLTMAKCERARAPLLLRKCYENRFACSLLFVFMFFVGNFSGEVLFASFYMHCRFRACHNNLCEAACFKLLTHIYNQRGCFYIFLLSPTSAPLFIALPLTTVDERNTNPSTLH